MNDVDTVPGDDAGLTASEAAHRLQVEGRNVLPSGERRGLSHSLRAVLGEPMFLLLLGAVSVYLLLGDVREALILAASLIVMVTISVVQERRSEKALDALRDLSSPRALVLRDGVQVRIAGADVVRGDVMFLAEGDRVAADARLCSGNDLSVDESLLTGESAPVNKFMVAGQDTLLHSGTLVVKGLGRAVVTATGSLTAMGRIGVSLASLDSGKTALQAETARIVKWIALTGFLLCALLAVMHALTRGDWLAGILAGLTLAMAILPEEFPLVLTIFLALGAWRMAQRGVLTRRMPALEMLGAATVLCVDKTGTLTENRMALTRVWHEGAWHDGAGVHSPSVAPVLVAAAMASEIDPFDPMERALIQTAESAAPDLSLRRREWQLDRDYPFSAQFQAVCHAWRAPDGGSYVAIKGAPETVLAACTLSEESRAAAMAEATRAAAQGLRVLGVAEGACFSNGGTSWPDDPRSFKFQWLGLVAFADPLRATVPAAVTTCRDAGIRVVMITGDYPATALAIAAEAGMDCSGGALTGAQIDAMTAAALAQAVRRASVFARVQPHQKLRLIAAFRDAGEVVAMTGDGVNDAPALKAAHIGIAMGTRGTDVAREAAALVLVNDDFGSLTDSVRTGRRIYENIRNAMAYLIAVHVPIAGMTFLPLLFGAPQILFPVHVVFLEFVIDPACTVVFEMEEADAGIMMRPPRDPGAVLFSRSLVVTSLILGLSALATVWMAYGIAMRAGYSEAEVRAMAFVGIVTGNLMMIFVSRAQVVSFWALLRRPNKAFQWIALITIGALAACIYIPAAAAVFRFAPLDAAAVALAAGAGLAGVLGFHALMRLVMRNRRHA